VPCVPTLTPTTAERPPSDPIRHARAESGRGESPSRPPEHGRLNRNRVPTKYRPPRRCGPTKLRRKQFPRNRALRSNTNTNQGRTTVFGSRPPRPGGSGRGASPSRPSRTACESRTEFLTQIAVASEMRPSPRPSWKSNSLQIRLFHPQFLEKTGASG